MATQLTRASTYRQYFTTAQTVTLPDATTLGNGWSFQIFNNSGGTVTVVNKSGSTIKAMADATWLECICTSTSSIAGTWQLIYKTQVTIGGTGTVTSVDMTVPTFLAVSGNPITTSGTLAVTLSGTALPIANGGTAGTSATTAFNNLSPVTTTGDLILGNGSNSNTRLAKGTQYQSLQTGATTLGWDAVHLDQSAAVTGVLPNANTTAASANTASAIVARDSSGNFTAGTITAALTGTASGNTTYSANNHGVVISSATNAMTIIAPDSSTSKVLVSGGSSADPSWSLLANANLTGSAAITNANLASMSNNTVKANKSGGSATPSDLALSSVTETGSSILTISNGSNTIVGASNLTIQHNLTSANIYVGNSSNVPVGVAVSGDLTVTNAGAFTVAKIQTTTVTGTTGTGNVVFDNAPTFAGAVNMGSHKITSVTDPTSAQDAATKNYVDTVASGLTPQEGCYAASTANIPNTYSNGVAGVGATITVTATGALSLDGTSPAITSRVLIKNQTNGFENGIYNVTLVGSLGVSPILTRALNYNTASDIDAGDLIAVENGTVNALTTWVQTANVTTVGSDSLVFTKFSINPSNVLTTTLTSAHLLVGNSSNIATDVAMSGDIAITNAGVTSIAATSNATFTTLSGLTTASSLATVGTISSGTWSATTVAVNKGGTGVTSVTTSPTASSFAGWDASQNLSANNMVKKYATTATAAGNTTLAVTDAGLQYFTGSTTQNVILPDATTLPRTGFQFYIVNLSTGTLTVKDNGSNTLNTIVGGANAWVTAKTIGTSNGTWDFQITTNNAGGGTVTSVTFTGDGTVLSSTPSAAVTTSGTLTAALANQSANVVLAGPSSGAAAAPTFRALVRADLGQGVIGRLAYRSVTGTDSASNTTDDVLILSSSSFTETLPTAVGVAGKVFYLIHNGTSITNIYTLNTTSSQTIGGIASGSYKLVTVGEELAVVSDGTNWQILYHVAETDWVNGGAITISGTTSNPTKPTGLTVDKFYWRRTGKELRVRMSYTQSNTTSAAAGSGDYLFTVIPSGLTIDSTQLTFYTTVAGTSPSNTVGNFLGGNGTTLMTGNAIAYSTTQIRIQYIDTTATSWLGSAKYPLTNASTLSFQANLQVPITEFQP